MTAVGEEPNRQLLADVVEQPIVARSYRWPNRNGGSFDRRRSERTCTAHHGGRLQQAGFVRRRGFVHEGLCALWLWRSIR